MAKFIELDFLANNRQSAIATIRRGFHEADLRLLLTGPNDINNAKSIASAEVSPEASLSIEDIGGGRFSVTACTPTIGKKQIIGSWQPMA